MSAQPSDRNAFLAELSAADYELFRPHLTSFILNVGDRLQDLGAAVEQVVFPHSGLVAMTMPLRSGGGGGAILVGRDGFVGGFSAGATAPPVYRLRRSVTCSTKARSCAGFWGGITRRSWCRRIRPRCATPPIRWR